MPHEAAEPGGERFNPNMTNEERRQASNLTLMCYRHHIETNDVAAFSAERLRELKRAHEARFSETKQPLHESQIEDITRSIQPGAPTTLRRYGDFIAPDPTRALTDEELQETLRDFLLPLVEEFAKLAPDTRAVFRIVLERGDGEAVPMKELQQVTGRGRAFLMGHIDTLNRYGFAYVEDDDDGREWVRARNVDSFWPFWHELTQYATAMGIPLAAFTQDLRFDLLD